MREFLVAELAKSILGPAELREDLTMDRGDSPLIKYLTGILAPKGSDFSVDVSELIDQANRGEEDWDSPIPAISGDIKPPMDPGNMVNTMGISFSTESKEEFGLKVCITWARYTGVKNGSDTTWTRNPRHIILSIDKKSAPEINIDENGNVTTVDADTEIRFSVIRRPHPTINNRWFFSLVVENRLIQTDENTDARECIFQPQIRVVCNTGTKVVKSFDPKFADKQKEEKDTYEILYRDRGIYARGRLVSATWKDIDPQICKDKSILKIPNSADETPFEWIDGQLLTDPNDKKLFEEPDVRTEYLPLYSIASPEYGWDVISKSDQGVQYTTEEPELSASILAELYDKETLKEKLEPITKAYEKWIDEVEANLKQFRSKKNDIVKRILDDERETLKRMHLGIKKLYDDDNVRLAFCFANKAIQMQHGWQSKKEFRYRPFQMGFILSTIESITDPKSKFRNTCDLLWVPTGAGKTEAYLMLTALLVSYRRLREIGNPNGANPGAGIAVITRYTLRLLAIQQFRRTLSLFCACENLRVEEQTDSTLGWRPKNCPKQRNILWGSTAFNVGLWVGQALAPNKLKKAKWPSGQGVKDGALDIIVKNKIPDGSDPCQVSNCPACDTILSVSPEGLKAGRLHTIFLTVKADAATVGSIENALQVGLGTSVTVNIRSSNNANTDYHTLALEITPTGLDFKGEDLNNRIKTAIDGLALTDTTGNRLPTEHTVSQANGDIICNGILETKPSRPGYFMRTHHVGGNNPRFVAYDFDIICPNPECPLANKEWFAGTPLGSRHNSSGTAQRNNTIKGKRLESWTSGTTNNQNILIDVQTAFQSSNNISERIPIPALTVDEQVYGKTPTMIVSTVDKFARPAFESEAGAIYGNVDHYHDLDGYYRSDARNGNPPHGSNTGAHLVSVQPHYAPELIIQDELHLIEGPLGSMVGIYETANDFLFSEGQETDAKYIASTATVKRAREQIKSVFNRELSLFPPHGHKINNRFFLKDEESHALDSEKSGRLYMGVCAPGKGGLTPHRKIWGSLLQSVYSQRNNPQISQSEFDKFWTLTGYFNAVRELAGVQALYSQDIPDEVKYLEDNIGDRRHLSEDRLVEISSRQAPTEIPSMLDTLNIEYTGPNSGSPDALLTTSMFGTGIDISRINAMIVAGQPKTTSSYIQATGRVGRNSGALVVTFLRAARPRDLSHYEIFTGNHRQLQRFVEAPTVYPFAEKNMNHCFGPMSVLILRNMRNKGRDWGLNANPIMTRNDRGLQECSNIPIIFERRAQSQPKLQQPPKSSGPLPTRSAEHIARINIEQWENMTTDQHGNALNLADDNANPPIHGFKFNEYFKPDSNSWNSVVLGDYNHQFARDKDPPQTPSVRIVYENAPQSLREVEADFKLQVADLRPGATPTSKQKPMGLRRSSFIYTYGPGSIAQTINGPRVIPTARIGLFDNNRRINPESHRIHNPRIDKVIPSLLGNDVQQEFQNCNGLAIYKIPTNEEVDFVENEPVHLTRAFPDERLCTNYLAHRDSLHIQYDAGILFEGRSANDGKCPICERLQDAPEARAVRFVTACKGGHMDEIAWGWWIHRNEPNQRCPGGHTTPLTGTSRQYNHERTFLWNSGGGATTATITITCPRCNNTVKFSDIKQGTRNCLGRNPEREQLGSQSGSSRHQGCPYESRVVLMQAANLRSSEILTLLSLDENSTPLEDIFFKPRAKDAADSFTKLVGEIVDSKLNQFLDFVEEQGFIQEGDMSILRSADRAEVVQAIQNRNPNFGDTYEELLTYEFGELIKGSISGVPATSTTGGKRNKFVMNYNNRKRF